MIDIKLLSPQKNLQKSTARSLKKTEAKSGVNQFHALTEDIKDAQPVESLQSMHGITVDHLIFNQGYYEGQREHYIQYGHDVLQRLEKLRDDVICGRMTLETLQDLRSVTAQSLPHTMDPSLKSILEDIRIRVEVELAKIESV